jgi:hypothetical protein
MVSLRKNLSLAALGLGALWVVVQGGLFFILGIRFASDTPRYLNAADTLLKGNWPGSVQVNYLTYDLLVAFHLWSGLGNAGIVLTQVLLTSVAAYCLYRLALKMYGRQTGLLAAFLYIGFAEIHTWNYYIIPESLFLSMTIISLFLVTEWRGWWSVPLSLLVLTLTFGLNPHSVSILLAVALYLVLTLWNQRMHKTLLVVLGIIVVLSPIVVNLVGRFADQYNLVANFLEGTVISAYKESAIKTPVNISAQLQDVSNPLFYMLLLIKESPMYFFQVLGMRLWYFFLHIRPYYSKVHNCVILATLVPSYALAAVGVLSRTSYSRERLMLLTVCGFQTVVVGLTFATWGGRYLLVLLPIVFLFAAHGMYKVWEWAIGIRMQRP